MPKQVITLNDFSGGLVTDKSDRALEPNELAECTNFDVSSKGKIVASRIFKQTSLYGQNSGGAEADPGYGLTVFSNDYLSSAPSTVNTGEFIVLKGGANELDLLEVSTVGENASSWDNNILSGSVTQIRQAFYAAEGDLFVGGTTSASPPLFAIPASYTFHKQLQIPSWVFTDATCDYNNGTTIAHDNDSGAVQVGQKVTGGDIAADTYVTAVASGTSFTISNATTGGSKTDQTLTFYGIGVHKWSVGTQDKSVPTGGAPGQKIYQSTTAGTGTTTASSAADIMHWVIKPSGSGLWTNDQSETSEVHEFMGTWLYKNDTESDMFALETGNTMTGAADFGLTDATGLYVQAWYGGGTTTGDAVPVTGTSELIYGARLYSRFAGDGGDYYLLAEMNMEKGIKGDGETEWHAWAAQTSAAPKAFDQSHDTGDSCETGLIAAPPALLTYKILNGFSTDDIPTDSRRVDFKCGLIANSRAYIGNVRINGRSYGDRILKSPIFQYDVFTEDNYLDVAINDGDQITALAAHGDRILQFKNSAVYIINVSKELEFLEDEQQGAGVAFQAAVTTTPFGVVWVNTNGCYLYDGEKISQLQLGKLSSTDWENVTSLATIGYDSAHQQVIVLWDSSAETTAFVFDAETGGWHKVTDMVNTSVNTTNMVNARGDKLLVGGGATADDINFLADRSTIAAQPEITKVVCVADSSDSLDGKYFLVYGNTGKTLVWIDTDNSGTSKPSGLSEDLALEITGIATNDPVEKVAIEIANTVGDHAEFLTEVQGDTVIITDASNATRTDASDGDAGFTVTTFQQGTGSTSSAYTGFSLKTKVLDLGNPESNKNLLEVAVVYKYGDAAASVKIITTADDGTATPTTLGVIDQTDGEVTTKEFDTSGTAALQGNKTYQVEISGTMDRRVEITSITLTYRDLGVH